jgi:2-amino-4-hydroxy-6-hydroxymethyldihydropteridine diphosphokinase
MAAAVGRVAVALGSNLGDRDAHLRFGASRLAAHLSEFRLSAFHETEPAGVGPQPMFLNAAAVGTTALTPESLLEILLAIEHDRGRERPYPGAPRTLDLDLILHGNAIVRTDRLIVPHPRFRERAFVLAPLAEIAPELVDPVSGRTVGALWDALRGGPGAGPA